MNKFWTIITVSFFLLNINNLHAQIFNQFDIALGYGANQQSLALSVQKQFSIGKKERLKLNYGFRFGTIAIKDMNYYSAPRAYFLIEDKMDTLFMPKSGQNNLAIMIGATHLIKNKIELGFNIDAIGYTFGKKRNGTLYTNGKEINDEVNPNQITALLVGPNDIGMVRAEFFAGYRIKESIMIRAGLTNLFTEYKTSEEFQEGNDRFRGAPSMPFLSARISI